MSKQIIDKTLWTEYRMITYDGVDLISRNALLVSINNNNLGAKAADFLAEPVRRTNFNELNWYTSIDQLSNVSDLPHEPQVDPVSYTD
jgi:hypothetical protein